MTRFLTIVFMAVFLVGCETNKRDIGTLLGAGVGALAGSQIGRGKGRMAAVAIGTLAGAWAGREIGRSLDRADRMAMNHAAHNALERTPTRGVSRWNNPDSGNHGSFTPMRTYRTSRGQHCREYQQDVTVGGRTQRAYGKACRQSDGSWRIVNR
tara:strand:- start:2495 stop:2956 length:462 start_codon:yes stop_codon:yes gene_type:complete